MIDPREVMELKDDIERLQREADKADGGLEQIKKELKAKYECLSIKEAIRLLKKKEKAARIAEKAYTKAKAEFDKEHGNVLERL